MIVSTNSQVEQWLARSAESFHALSDREYRALAPKWRSAFSSSLKSGGLVQADAALIELELRLPCTLYVFNGLLIPQVANSSVNHPCAYLARGVREIQLSLVNARDLILAEAGLSFSYVGTHEWRVAGIR